MSGGIEQSRQFWGIQVQNGENWNTLQIHDPGPDALSLAAKLEQKISKPVRVAITDQRGMSMGPVIPHTSSTPSAPEADTSLALSKMKKPDRREVVPKDKKTEIGAPAKKPAAPKPAAKKPAAKTPANDTPTAGPRVYDSRSGKAKRIM